MAAVFWPLLQVNVLPPDAVSVVLAPGQMVELAGVIRATVAELTVTVAVVTDEQPDVVAVTEYAPGGTHRDGGRGFARVPEVTGSARCR